MTLVEDTIAAISTPIGESALAIVRVSGGKALAVGDGVFVPAGRSSMKPSAALTHTVHYGRIVRAGRLVDEVMLTVLRAPRTATREDMIEISCHGGVLTARLVLDAVLELGARLALPGEFTKRAFLNGRIDLVQAEAVADLIHSRTELAQQAAQQQLAGKLSERIRGLRDALIRALAHIEAHIDFPDEDIAPDTLVQLLDRLEGALDSIECLLRTAREGKLLRHGVRAAIAGRPNVGKSSLLNQLLGHDRAIVSSTAGTTRDTIEETANVRGLPVVFIDTAGLRDSDNEIEKEGIRRSRQSLANAELVLHVLDGSIPWTPDDCQPIRELSTKKQIIIRNKSDLAAAWTDMPGVTAPVVAVSCVTGAGLEDLKDTIQRLIWGGTIDSSAVEVTISARHQNALLRAKTSIGLAAESLRSGATLELVAVDLRSGAQAVGEIVGKTSTEDLLDAIFGQFCIGK